MKSSMRKWPATVRKANQPLSYGVASVRSKTSRSSLY
ncbi:hypothetical protein SAMN05421541_102647 [Actinoplanes philippinensis]|uniref:Uncharacterized protein n=1 Tax=Actinoplanes philippinensis TaxID=35752 RepID=A0A1I2C1A9_9ACTN|nr:hypothetical protein SAMN05421541_102647 [Actinoplanes philippinensis]